MVTAKTQINLWLSNEVVETNKTWKMEEFTWSLEKAYIMIKSNSLNLKVSFQLRQKNYNEVRGIPTNAKLPKSYDFCKCGVIYGLRGAKHRENGNSRHKRAKVTKKWLHNHNFFHASHQMQVKWLAITSIKNVWALMNKWNKWSFFEGLMQ